MAVPAAGTAAVSCIAMKGVVPPVTAGGAFDALERQRHRRGSAELIVNVPAAGGAVTAGEPGWWPWQARRPPGPRRRASTWSRASAR